MNAINSTPSSLLAQRSLRNISLAMNKSLERLATAQRINRGSDDPAGLIVSEKLRAILAELEAESSSLERADNVVTTADAALGEVSDLLGRADALAVANANTAGTSKEERLANQMEIDSIMAEVDRIAGSTAFNGDDLLDGTAEVSATGTSITIDSVYTSDLGEVEIDDETYYLTNVKSGGALDTVNGDVAGAQEAIRAASSQVATLRGKLGAFSKNTIGSRLNTLAVSIENLTAAESLIRDTDYSQEGTNLDRLRILYDAATQAVKLTSTGAKTVLDLLG